MSYTNGIGNSQNPFAAEASASNAASGLVLPVGILLATAPVAWVCLRGAEASIKSTVRLMLIETAVVVALSITIVIVQARQPGAINFSAFDPHRGSSFSGFWTAMILGVLAFCGFGIK